jgi:hypothetical protein
MSIGQNDRAVPGSKMVHGNLQQDAITLVRFREPVGLGGGGQISEEYSRYGALTRRKMVPAE